MGALREHIASDSIRQIKGTLCHSLAQTSGYREMEGMLAASARPPCNLARIAYCSPADLSRGVNHG